MEGESVAPRRPVRRRTNYRPARRRTSRKTTTKLTTLQAALLGGSLLLAVSVPAAGVPLLVLIGGSLWYVQATARRGSPPRLRRKAPTRTAVPTTNYLALSPKQFEEALAQLCRRDGCTNVQVVGGAGDRGADVICIAPDGRKLVIQAKRFAPTNKVGDEVVQVVNGTYRDAHGAQLAAIVTTSTFTKPALQYARKLGIRPYDGTKLAAWASRTGPAPWH